MAIGVIQSMDRWSIKHQKVTCIAVGVGKENQSNPEGTHTVMPRWQQQAGVCQLHTEPSRRHRSMGTAMPVDFLSPKVSLALCLLEKLEKKTAVRAV